MSSDYQAVQKALSGGTEPRMLCQTCPWDRNCVTPPTMTSADVEAQIEQAVAKDQAKAEQARMMGRQPEMPVGALLTTLFLGTRDTSAQVCPVFALRLRSSGGRKIADQFKALMQDWDDQK